MNVCDRCTQNHECAWQNHEEPICKDSPAYPMTNAYVLRHIDDDRLAFFIAELVGNNLKAVGIRTYNLDASIEATKAWLKQEAAYGDDSV